ncbi:hypothetical protein [Glutamicibacter endophyticus]|uniref:hypothetical protein n=1 Tax=Glutamicibacter endophyticus TaxID=1522174 RepID=UPI003AEF8B86
MNIGDQSPALVLARTIDTGETLSIFDEDAAGTTPCSWILSIQAHSTGGLPSIHW